MAKPTADRSFLCSSKFSEKIFGFLFIDIVGMGVYNMQSYDIL